MTEENKSKTVFWKERDSIYAPLRFIAVIGLTSKPDQEFDPFLPAFLLDIKLSSSYIDPTEIKSLQKGGLLCLNYGRTQLLNNG